MVNTAGRGRYKAEVQNIYGVLPPPLEEHHEAINNLNNIVQGMKKQSYKLEGLEQANSLLTSSNSDVMSQLAEMTVTVNAIQKQLKKNHQQQQTQQVPRESFTFGYVGAILLMEVKSAQPIKRATRRKHTKSSNRAESTKGSNYGYEIKIKFVTLKLV